MAKIILHVYSTLDTSSYQMDDEDDATDYDDNDEDDEEIYDDGEDTNDEDSENE